MKKNKNLLWIVLYILNKISTSSSANYNQPKFCPRAAWNSEASTFLNILEHDHILDSFFVDIDNTVIVPVEHLNKTIVLYVTTDNLTKIDINVTYDLTAIFVNTDGNLLFSDRGTRGVYKLTLNELKIEPIRMFNATCYGLFVLDDNTIYCSLYSLHQVVTVTFNDSSNTSSLVADELKYPYGIFVDENLNLYVADSGNNRIQCFQFKSEYLEGTTVAGTSNTIELDNPTSITLDADKYLFIVDSNNHRIIASGPDGFRCILGCFRTYGSRRSQLHNPLALNFDNNGNIFILDKGNQLIQKLHLTTNSCNDSYAMPKFCSMISWDQNPVMLMEKNEYDEISIVDQQIFQLWFNKTTRPTVINYGSLFYSHSLTISVNGDIYFYIDDTENDMSYCKTPIRTFTRSFKKSKKPSKNRGINWLINLGKNWEENWEMILVEYFRLCCRGKKENWCDHHDNRHGHSFPKFECNIIEKNLTAMGSSVLNETDIDDFGMIYKWSLTTNCATHVANITGSCFSLFMDNNNSSSIYCSMINDHQVVKIQLNDSENTTDIVAGNGTNGSESDMLYYPSGIFVNKTFYLYVADCYNHRIQCFASNDRNGITVAGKTKPETITLSYPTAILLDGNEYLFILDSGNRRIVGSSSTGFRCMVGCSESNEYSFAAFTFDSYGNLLVFDDAKELLQEFHLSTNSCKLSYNEPKFCSHAEWDPKGKTFSELTHFTGTQIGLFVDASNIIYIPNQNGDYIHSWSSGATNSNRDIFKNISNPASLFVTSNGDVFVNNDKENRIEKQTVNSTQIIPIMSVNSTCYGLFIDLNDMIYCSMKDLHQVIQKSLDNSHDNVSVIAGDGSPGSTMDMLDNPHGIFVSTSSDLYVADCGNDRIQLFTYPDRNGTTVAGNQLTKTIKLNCPTAIALNIDQSLFIVDSKNHRIVRSIPDGFRCVIGCSGDRGPDINTLNQPTSIAFDSYGNMFVADTANKRIQKFDFIQSSCYKTQLIYLIVPPCIDYTPTGIPCAKINSICEMTNPCPKNMICAENLTDDSPYSYSCLQSPNFTYSVCDSEPCWNNGTCAESSDENLNFTCNCTMGWEGLYCEKMIDYCSTVQCENNGICRPSLMNYTCECLGDDYYYGRHCENQTMRLTIYKTASKSFGYVGIIALLCIVLFVVTMDVLKYGFGVDPVDKEIKRIRHAKIMKKQERRIARRLVYPRYLLNRLPRSTLIRAKITFRQMN